MRYAIAFVLLVHALIHLMGFLKAFHLAELPQLTLPISRSMGVVWLAAAALMVGALAAHFTWSRGYWIVAAAALILSQMVIISAWKDAKFGTVANALVLLTAVYGFLTQGPWSFQAQFDSAARAGLASTKDAPMVTEADLTRLPAPVQRYLRAVGVVGHPRVHNYQIHFTGRIRSGPQSDWMPFTAVQQSFVHPPTRLFLMTATMKGLPVQAFHKYVDGTATMDVKLLGAIPIVAASGSVMDKSEAVTVLNDMALLAPGTLLEPSIEWQTAGEHEAIAIYHSTLHTVRATLVFGADGMLINFISDDRSRSSPDGKSFTQLRFTTPVLDHRRHGAFRLSGLGEARWHAPEGEFAYGEFDPVDITFNASQPPR